MNHKGAFDTAELKCDADYLAPDGSEIRLLATVNGGGLCHCTLPVGKTSSPVKHRQVEEIWYVLGGNGEVWREHAGVEDIVAVSSGKSLTIKPGVAFQFRNNGAEPLVVLIATMPPWPGPHEAQEAVGKWPATKG